MAELTYPYEQAAMRGEEMPKGLNIVDQLIFLSLRDLYAQKRAGIIDREIGSREKAKLRYQRDLWEGRLMLGEKLAQKSAKMFKEVEAAASAYARERTLERADEIYRALYGMDVPGIRREAAP